MDKVGFLNAGSWLTLYLYFVEVVVRFCDVRPDYRQANYAEHIILKDLKFAELENLTMVEYDV